MPYRHAPPFTRPRWEQAALLWLLGWVAQGAYGLLWPSVALQSALGVGQVIYSVACILVGTLGGFAWWHGYKEATFRAMFTLLALTVAHGVSVWVMTGVDGGQTAIRLLTAAIGTYAWIGCRAAFGLSTAEINEATERIGEPPPGRARKA